MNRLTNTLSDNIWYINYSNIFFAIVLDITWQSTRKKPTAMMNRLISPDARWALGGLCLKLNDDSWISRIGPWNTAQKEEKERAKIYKIAWKNDQKLLKNDQQLLKMRWLSQSKLCLVSLLVAPLWTNPTHRREQPRRSWTVPAPSPP